MPIYDAISQAAAEAFEVAMRGNRSRSTVQPVATPIDAANAFAAALLQNALVLDHPAQDRIEIHYEREYCRKGEWQKGWKSALNRQDPPCCRTAWEANMRETLLQDVLSQTSPL